MPIIIPFKNIPFQGGVDTAHEIALLETGAFSQAQNVRPTRPGFIQRKGCIKQHTTAADAQETINGYQFCKGTVVERHLYRQLADGSLQEATSNPPTVTTGNFGTERLSAATGAAPASFGNINDIMVFADGARQAQINPGNSQKVYGFHVYKGAAPSIPDIPTYGEDYTAEVNDSQTTTYAVLSSLNTLANYHCFFVVTPVRGNKVTLTVRTANTVTATLSAKYRKSDGTWAALTISDGTAASGKTLTQSGDITWTMPSDEVPHYSFDKSGFIIQFAVSAQLSSDVTISAATFGGTFQDVINLWDGVMPDVIEARLYDSSQGKYSVFAGTSVDLSSMDTADELTLLTADPIIGFYADPGATPNKASGTVTGSDIAFVDGGTGDDTITRTTGDFLIQGFEAGRTIAITDHATNNQTGLMLKKVSTTTLTVETGKLTAAPVGDSCTLTIEGGVAAINSVQVHTGSAFPSLTNINDGTAGMSKAGFVTFSRNTEAKKINFQGSGFYAYAYRIKFDKKLSSGVLASFQYLPFFDINKTHYPVVQSVCIWKNRVCYAFKGFGDILYFSARSSPMVLNGGDGEGRVKIGAGSKNDILCMRKFYNELLVWQAEKGEEGGSLTIVEGDTPTGQMAFDKKLISSRYGIVNSKSAVVLEGVNISEMNTDRPIATVAYWISRDGVFKTNGVTFSSADADISNFFDPTKSECIVKGKEDKHWMAYDRAYKVVRMGLCCGNPPAGTSADMANRFFVLDPLTGKWITDVLTQPISCMFEVEAETGNLIVLQMGGGQDGYVRQLNTTNSDESTAIDASVTMEINGKGERIRVKKDSLRCKSQPAGNIVRTIMADGNPAVKDTKTLTMTAKIANDVYRRHFKTNPTEGDHLSIKWRHNTAGEACHFLDLGIEVETIDSNPLTSDT